MNPASSPGSGPARSMADGRAVPNATSSVTAPASSHCGSSGWQSHSARSSRAVMAAQTWTASPAGSAIAAARAATAASTACDSAHWRTRAGSPVIAPSVAGCGTGVGQPVRWASTASSAQARIGPEPSSSRCAVRMSRSVHGRAWHSPPQVADRGCTTARASAAGTGGADSLALPSFTRTRIGKSMPSENTAACPGGRVTR
jgi:hypothetical protein